MKKILMSRGADKVVSTCVKVQPGEEVVIITEESKMRIAEAVAGAVYPGGGAPIPLYMGKENRTARNLQDP